MKRLQRTGAVTILIALLLVQYGCMTEKKWAEGCAAKFPVKESTVYVPGEVKYDTAYLAPDTLVFTDTVTVDCDTAKGIVTKYVYKEKACPPAPVITKYQVDTMIVTQENTAAVAAEQIGRIQAETKLAREKKIARFFICATLILLGLGAIFLFSGNIISRIKGIFK